MSSSSDVSRIVFNQMSDNKYDTLTPTEGEFYCTPDYIDLPILTSMWFDHIVNDIQWLRADTFSWQSGDVYTAVYNHLVSDISGKTAVSENVGGVTISYYLADDGHKITTDETSVANIYTATGVAWYYILDTANHRFKLPRTKFGFTGLRDNVGNYVAPGLPNITGTMLGGGQGGNDPSYFTGAFARAGSGPSKTYGASTGETCNNVANFYASRSSSIYGNSTTVQSPATQMYLYFYVGNFTKTAIEQTAGITSEALNNKADISLLDNKVDKQLTGYISVTCQNGFAGNVGYFIKDGWCTVRFWHLKGGSVAQGQYPLGNSQQLPRPYGYSQYAMPLCMANNGGQVGIWVYWEANDSNLKCHCYNATNNCYGTFTYPIA